MFTARRRRASGTPRVPGGGGKGVRFGRWQSRVRGLPEYFGELPAVGAGRGDRHARRGPGARADHRGRQPVRLDAQQRPARARGRVARLHGRDRHLRERDDPARGRDPARAGAAREGALRPRALPARGPQRRELLAARARARGAGRVGGLHAPRRGSSPARGRTPTSTRFDDMVIQTLVQREVGTDGSRVAGPRPGRAARGARAAPRPRARARLHAARRAPTATASAPTPTGLTLDVLERSPHGVDLGPLAAAPARGAAHAVGQDRAGAARRSSPTSTGCAAALGARAQRRPRADRPPRSCARTTRGCTTCPRS